MKTKNSTLKDYYKKYYKAIYNVMLFNEIGSKEGTEFWIESVKFFKTGIAHESIKIKR